MWGYGGVGETKPEKVEEGWSKGGEKARWGLRSLSHRSSRDSLRSLSFKHPRARCGLALEVDHGCQLLFCELVYGGRVAVALELERAAHADRARGALFLHWRGAVRAQVHLVVALAFSLGRLVTRSRMHIVALR